MYTKILMTLDDTISLGKVIASKLSDGNILLLHGDLGSGKTTLCRSIIHSFYPNADVTSPTFNILHPYTTNSRDTKIPTIYHYDLYRLKSQDEIYELGLLDNIDNGISIIEWPDIIRDLMPKEAIDIYLNLFNKNVAEHTSTTDFDPNMRHISIKNLILE